MAKANLTAALKVLQTDEARGTLIYDIFKKRYRQEDGDVSEIPSPFPEELSGGVNHAVGLAFREGNFRLGFAIATQGGVLEQVAEQVEEAPYDIKWLRERVCSIPKTWKTLPGFPEKREFEPDFIDRASIWVKYTNS